MTVPLQRVDVQRVLNSVPRKAITPPGTFATVLAKAQPLGGGSRPSAAAPRSPTAPVSRRATSAPQGAQSPPGSSSVPYQSQIDAAARKYGIDPALLAAVAKTESNFNPGAQSKAGAKGLMQLMDATARGLGVSDPFDPAQSLDGGARFLSGLLKQFHGDLRLAVAAYNAGPVAVQKYGGIPPYQETQRYVPKVLTQVDAFRRIWADQSSLPENS